MLCPTSVDGLYMTENEIANRCAKSEDCVAYDFTIGYMGGYGRLCSDKTGDSSIPGWKMCRKGTE